MPRRQGRGTKSKEVKNQGTQTVLVIMNYIYTAGVLGPTGEVQV